MGRRDFGEFLGDERGEFAADHEAHGGEVVEFVAEVVGAVGERTESGELRDDGRADDERVLDFAQGGFEGGGVNHPADAPTGEAVGLGHGVERDRVGGGARDRGG